MAASVLPYQFVSEIFFCGFVVLALSGGIIAVSARYLLHALLGLVVTLFGVAGLYLYLGSFFISLMQVLIYVGAICVTIVFAIMLTETPDQVKENHKSGLRSFLAAGAGLAALSCAFQFIYLTEWQPALSRTDDFSIIAVGKRLLTEYCLVFEMISLVLLFAIIGSIILARGGRGN